MKVLHVITTNARGGAENHLVDLIEAQIAHGLEVHFASLKGDGYWTHRLEAVGCRVHDLRLTRYGDPLPVFKLRGILSAFKPQLVHAHMPPAELYSRLAMIGRTELLAISKHNDQTFYRGNVDILVERWCAARASQVICISDAVKRYFARRWSTALSARLAVVHYGLNSTPYEQVTPASRCELREELGVSPDTVLFGTVARLVPQKSLDSLLNAFSIFRNTHPRIPSKLLIVGRGPLEAQLRNVSSLCGVEDDVIWAGFRTDIPAIMSAIDVFVLCSRFEGFGLVLLEAMAAKRPIIATSVSAIPEVVVNEKTGVLVPAQTPEAMAQAMARLLAPSLRKEMGEAGHQRVLNMFTIDAMVNSTLRLYSSLIETT